MTATDIFVEKFSGGERRVLKLLSNAVEPVLVICEVFLSGGFKGVLYSMAGHDLCLSSLQFLGPLSLSDTQI